MDELGSHLISDHPSKPKLTRLKMVKDELRGLNKVLGRLEKQSLGLADYAQGLRKLANAVGVLADEVGALQSEVAGINDDLGDMELEREEKEPD